MLQKATTCRSNPAGSCFFRKFCVFWTNTVIRCCIASGAKLSFASVCQFSAHKVFKIDVIRVL